MKRHFTAWLLIGAVLTTLPPADTRAQGTATLPDYLRLVVEFIIEARQFLSDMALDHNQDGNVNIADAIKLLNQLYNSTPLPETYELNCYNAFDAISIGHGVPQSGIQTVTLDI